MTVISSLFSGISGIIANGSALSVAGDNIANMSTPSFKSSTPVFESALSQRIGSAQIGLGSRLASTSANFTQGAFSSSTRPTDLAIDGKGFFVFRNSGGETFYSRAGILEKNQDGDLVTSGGGLILQGYQVDANGTVSGTLSGINLQSVSSAPVETDEMAFSMNLNANESTPGTNNWTTFANAQLSSNFSTSKTIYDSLGNAITVTTYFRKTATANQWEYRTLTLGDNITGYTGNNQAGSAVTDGTVIVAQGTMTFNTDGSLLSVTPILSAVNDGDALIEAGDKLSSIPWVGADTVAAITHDFGFGGGEGIVTQYAASESSVTAVNQNGRAAGVLQTFEFSADGTLKGNFSNGTSRELFKVPIATFANEEGLERAGSNAFQSTATSGEAQIGLAATAGKGEVRAFAIEQSNVDLATEFVRIITFQRAFQASSRTVSTAAELLQDLVNLGR